jgi:hypothetical protein
MADDANRSIINHKGQVFGGTTAGSGAHTGLCVIDGSVVPTAIRFSLISALAERSCYEMARDYRWTIAY